MPAWFSGDALVALAAAAFWGGGDFSGGMAVKAAGGSTRGALRVVLIAYGASLAGILLVLFTKPAARPSTLQTAGFALAAGAIWIIAAAPSGDRRMPEDPAGTAAARSTLALAVLAGVGFGLYFVALRMDNALGILEPLALARSASLATCGLVLAALSLRASGSRGDSPKRLSRKAFAWALGVAGLDTGGDLLFVQATRLGRLDVAAVLTSLYPAVTIFLAIGILQEKPTKRQAAGMAAALIAVVMIVL